MGAAKPPSSKFDDRSEEHLNWLVHSRSVNQQCSLHIYLLLENNPIVHTSIRFQRIAIALTSVAFSLWRAVFLSDLKGNPDDHMADLSTFLGNLISNNTIAYQQDKNAREFTFRYYLSDAELRLEKLIDEFSTILQPNEFQIKEVDVKTAWTSAQSALDVAVGRFEKLLADM